VQEKFFKKKKKKKKKRERIILSSPDIVTFLGTIEMEGEQVAYCALGIMAVVPIFFGSFRTLESDKPKADQEIKEEKETISSADATRFPLYGSATLFGLYLLFRYLPKEYINLILSSYFALMGIASVVNLLHPTISPLLFLVFPRGETFELSLKRGKKGRPSTFSLPFCNPNTKLTPPSLPLFSLLWK